MYLGPLMTSIKVTFVGAGPEAMITPCRSLGQPRAPADVLTGEEKDEGVSAVTLLEQRRLDVLSVDGEGELNPLYTNEGDVGFKVLSSRRGGVDGR